MKILFRGSSSVLSWPSGKHSKAQVLSSRLSNMPVDFQEEEGKERKSDGLVLLCSPLV